MQQRREAAALYPSQCSQIPDRVAVAAVETAYEINRTVLAYQSR